MFNLKTLVNLAAATAVLTASLPAAAAPTLVTNAAGYSGPQLDLTGVAGTYTSGSVLLPGGISLTASPGFSNPQGSFIGQWTPALTTYGLADNGHLESPAAFIGLNSGTGWIELAFATPVTSFGGYWNYWRVEELGQSYTDGDDPWISIVDSNDVTLTFDLLALAPIETLGGVNDFRFRGIVDLDGIKSLRFGGSYMVLAGTADGSLPSVTAAVPEPETYAMLLAGLGLMSLVARRRRKSAA